jgi:Bacterial PH domain
MAAVGQRATYRSRGACGVVAVLWSGFALLGVAGLTNPDQLDLGGLLLVGGLLPLSGWLGWRAARARLVVDDDSLTVHGFFRTRRIPWPQVAAVEVGDNGAWVDWACVVVRLRSGKQVKVEAVRSLAAFRDYDQTPAAGIARELEQRRTNLART